MPRVLTISHSYVVANNRRLAHEIAAVEGGRWDVTAVAPSYFHGGNDLRPLHFEPLEDEPVPVEILPARLTQNIHAFWYGRHLKTLLRRPWDVVHAWEEPFNVSGFQVALHVPREAKLVYRTAQSLKKRYPPPFRQFEERAMVRADAWICSGSLVRRTLEDNALYRDKPWRLIPLGVDAEAFAPDPEAGEAVRRRLGWPTSDGVVVGFLGRVTEAKGLRVLMQALDRLPSGTWRLLIVGDGNLKPEVQEWAKPHGDRVRICDTVRHVDVPAYLSAMDLLCAPSLTTPSWREQFGRMLIEGFAARVPVVGSDSGEIPNVIGDAGVVVPEGDAERLSVALAALAADPERRERLADAGEERVHTRFTWRRVAEAHASFFTELLDAGSIGGNAGDA